MARPHQNSSGHGDYSHGRDIVVLGFTSTYLHGYNEVMARKRIRTDKDRARDKQRREERLANDPEFIIRERLRGRLYHQENREAANARSKEWAGRNAARAKEVARAWQRDNPDARRATKRKHRAKKFGDSPDRQRAFSERRDINWLCAELRGGNITLDEFNRRIRENYVRGDGSFRERGEGG